MIITKGLGAIPETQQGEGGEGEAVFALPLEVVDITPKVEVIRL